MKELLIPLILVAHIVQIESRVPQASTLTLEIEGLPKIELLSFGKNAESFTIAINKEDLQVLNQWDTKRSAVIRIETATGEVTNLSMTGALVKKIIDDYNIEVTYDTLSSPLNNE